MANPRQSHWDRLVRLAKYLKGRMRYAIKFARQVGVHSINTFGDSDFAGEVDTRKSTSGGMMCIGDHMIKSWSTTQSLIALSTGEADLYAIKKSAANGLGAWSLLSDMGLTLDIRVYTDATTGKSIASRRGLGKVRHISVNELWIQELVQNKSVTIVKIKNKFNPSDILTKHLGRAEIEMIMEHVQHCYEQGRAAAAPKLAITDEKKIMHDEELHSVSKDQQYQVCYCRGYGVSMN